MRKKEHLLNYLSLNQAKANKAAGSRTGDFKQANELCGFSETPPGYTWHHLDDYNVTTNIFTLELVLRWAHRATTPHSGGCAMYKAATGRRYK